MENKSILHRLGDYIRQVDVRNRDLAVDKLVGLTIDKKFIPSVANTIGTDLSNYKIISKNQFACSLMQVSRDGKMPIAIFKDELAIMSPAYPMFEITRISELLPDFLMMWFSRSEFDRQAAFFAVGGVRGSLTWEDFCDFEIPVPPIKEQRKIVAQYQAIEQRIENNRRLIAALEATAQAIYRNMFVDNIDPNNLPEGWHMKPLIDIAEYFNGAACQKFASSIKYLPVLKIKELGQGFANDGSDFVDKTIPKEYIVKNNDLIFSWSATLLIDFWAGGEVALNQHLFKVTPKDVPDWFIYFGTQQHIENWKRIISAKATSMSHIKREDLENAFVVVPNGLFLNQTNAIISPLMNYYKLLKREFIFLYRSRYLILSKLSSL